MNDTEKFIRKRLLISDAKETSFIMNSLDEVVSCIRQYVKIKLEEHKKNVFLYGEDAKTDY